MNKPQSKIVTEPNPAGRVDVLVERMVDRWMKIFVDNHPLTQRLKQVGLDSSSIVREAIEHKLKKERITSVKSVMRALRRS